ncbi:pseudouridine synthase [Peribacillus frigoritolerans]|nr:pseudouridine synthase [Peribacillus frigoritolerans]
MIKHIHRLDKDTTGAVLFAKNRLIGSMLDRMLEEREIKRTYLALVEGNIKKDEGEIKEKNWT